MNMEMIDVSEWQAKIDWQKVKKSGVNFAIIRAGLGTSIDKRAKENAENAHKAGIHIGFYWYAMSRPLASEQARKFIDTVKSVGVTPNLPLFCDYEKDTDKAGMLAFVNIFCEIVRAAGYNAGIYSNAARLALLPKEVLSDFVIWCADWRGSCGCKYASYWQYTDKGKVPGINTNVDLNKILSPLTIDEVAQKVIFGDFGNGTMRTEKLKTSGYDPPSVQARVNEYYSIAKRVISGCYGNGSTRKENLIKLGYAPETVQNIVNAMLKG